jgi:multidrug resistance efflux pump
VDLEEATRERPLLKQRQEAELADLDSELESVHAQWTEEQVRLDEIGLLLSRARVIAETGGKVLGEGLDELAGQAVLEGQELLRVATGAVERFEGLLGDRGRAVARVGLPVKIRLDGYPWLVHGTLAGTVVQVVDGPGSGGGFPVHIDVDPSAGPGRVYEGMAGEARIVVAEQVPLGRLLVERLSGADEP